MEDTAICQTSKAKGRICAWVPRFGVLKIQSWYRCHVGQTPCPQFWLTSSEDDWLSLRTEQWLKAWDWELLTTTTSVSVRWWCPPRGPGAVCHTFTL